LPATTPTGKKRKGELPRLLKMRSAGLLGLGGEGEHGKKKKPGKKSRRGPAAGRTHRKPATGGKQVWEQAGRAKKSGEGGGEK